MPRQVASVPPVPLAIRATAAHFCRMSSCRSIHSHGRECRAPGVARWVRVCAVVLPLCLLGCSLGFWSPRFWIPSEARKRLDDAAFRYNNALRFGNLDMAVGFVEPEQRASFLEMFADTGSSPIRFTEVDVGAISLGPESDRASVELSVRYYRLPSLREVQFSQRQRWRYDPKAAQWFVEPELERYAAADRL